MEIMLKAPRIMLEPLRIIAKAPGMAKAPRIMVKAPRIMAKAPHIYNARTTASYKWRKHRVLA
jgi:hypothetical protein